MHVKKEQLEMDIEQQTGSKLGKEYVKAIYCHPAYLSFMDGKTRKFSIRVLKSELDHEG